MIVAALVRGLVFLVASAVVIGFLVWCQMQIEGSDDETKGDEPCDR